MASDGMMKGSRRVAGLTLAVTVAVLMLLGARFTGSFVFVSGTNSELRMWSSADIEGGTVTAFINEDTMFYANFSATATGLPIEGAGVGCTITFNDTGQWSPSEDMTYNSGTGLYEYTKAFPYAGNHSWRVACDGALQGYDPSIQGTDNVTVHLYEWWNDSWKYRVRIDLRNQGQVLLYWPVELDINLTDALRSVGSEGTIDDNSTRIVEYNSTGSVMHELPSQFDKAEGYNPSGSALGTAVFMANGTTPAYQNRTFFLYYDIQEDGLKSLPNYATNLTYALPGDEIHVNTSEFSFLIDTNRSESTSGLYDARLKGYPLPFFLVGSDERTVEYMEYSNGTHNLSFDLASDVEIVQGPVRLTVIQRGAEHVFGDPSLTTGEGTMTKEYHIYNRAWNESLGTFMRISQNFTNIAGYSIERNSTPSGSIAVDAGRGWVNTGSTVSFYEVNSTDPYSWSFVASTFLQVLGMVNLYENTDEFTVKNTSSYERIGSELSMTTIGDGESLLNTIALYIGSGETTEFIDTRDAFRDPPDITIGDYDSMSLVSVTAADHSTYNRNETAVIEANVSYDPYGLISSVNLTLSNGTPGTGDDYVIVMLDDGTGYDQAENDSVYTASYNFTTAENTGTWTATTNLYDENGTLLNMSEYNFTLTDELYVNTTVLNRNGEINRLVNATLEVMNYRQDVWQAGAAVNCSVWDGTTILSVVDQQNIVETSSGSFFLNFTAPAYFGSFTLNCTAEKAGNIGYDTSDFGAEDTKTNVSLALSPQNYTAYNVTWYDDESFMLRVNTTNTENGTAYNATVQIQLPQDITSNSTSHMCETEEGDDQIMIGKTCYIDFNLTIKNGTGPATFNVNLTVAWNNSNGMDGYNETNINITVEPTYIMQLPQDNITTMIARGINKSIGNVTIYSLGNAPLENVTFTVSGLDPEFGFSFMPVNYSSVSAGAIMEAEVYLLVDESYDTGPYTGMLNVTSANDGYKEIDLNITVSGTNVSLDVLPENLTAENITYYSGQNFTIGFNSTNMGNNAAYNTNLTLQFSDPLLNTANTTPYQCGDLAPGANCTGTFIITVSNGTPSGNYTINVSVEWGSPEIGVMYNSSIINLTVLSNVNLTVPDESVNGSVTHGSTASIGSFTMNSTGNDPVEGIELIIVDTYGELSGFTLVLTPNVSQTQSGNMSAGQIIDVDVSVSVPLSYPNGTYAGFLNVTTNNSGYKTLGLEVTVPETRTWNVTPVSCDHPESPEEGIVCNITVNNTGNVNISFQIFPVATGDSNLTMNNYTWPEITNFVLENQTGVYFSMFYNVTDAPLLFYNASYKLSAYYGIPTSRNISLLLTPFVKPAISFNVTPSNLPQLNSTEILVAVTDQGGVAGINFTHVNVTRPGGGTDQIVMRRVGTGTDPYIYQEFYPTDPLNGTWGSTLSSGNYTVFVYAEDNLGLNETVNQTFYVYAVMNVSLGTTRTSSEYYQGETGTLSYSVSDLEGTPIPGVNVSIGIKDPLNRTVNMEGNQFSTNANGEPSSYPVFELFSDSPTGSYLINATSAYNDTYISLLSSVTTETNFSVIEKKPGVLTLDLEAPSVVSTDDGLEVYATITDGVANTDPDWIMVSLYDSMDNMILENQSMAHQSLGRYNRWYNTSVSVNTGSWRWHVTMSKDGNVISKDIFTRLVGGLFDVRNITIVDASQPTLEISVIIENTGDIPQDAFILWNLSRLDTGERLKDGMDTVRIDPGEEYTFTINPSDISYTGEARILFVVRYSGTENAASFKDFTITEEEEQPPSQPPGGGAAGGEDEGGAAGGAAIPTGKPELDISKYPDEIATEAGWSQYPSVTVNNTGAVALHNIVITLKGIPDSWYNVSPKMIPILNPGQTGTFVVNLLVPPGTEAKQYYGVLNATSKEEASDEEMTSVIVFGSRKELVEYQLRKLKQEFADFKEDVNATAKRGEKDLTRVYSLMDEIQHQIDLTEGYIDAKMYDEALESVTTGWRLLDRARELLRDAQLLQPVTVLSIPDWMITLILVLVIVALTMFVLLNRYKKKLDRVFRFRKGTTEQAEGAAEAVSSAAETLGSGSHEEAQAEAIVKRNAEKEKINKVLALLEREYNEGIISEKAYNELRKRNMEKLKEFE